MTHNPRTERISDNFFHAVFANWPSYRRWVGGLWRYCEDYRRWYKIIELPPHPLKQEERWPKK